MSDDINTDEPASEQFDLTEGMKDEYGEPAPTTERMGELAAELERAEDIQFGEWPDDALADFIAACKRLESAAEDARKDHAEPALDERVAEGESVGPLTKASGASTWVEDTEGAFAAVADAGEDPLSVAKVNVGDLRDTLGAKADEFLGQSEYTYFRRQS